MLVSIHVLARVVKGQYTVFLNFKGQCVVNFFCSGLVLSGLCAPRGHMGGGVKDRVVFLCVVLFCGANFWLQTVKNGKSLVSRVATV